MPIPAIRVLETNSVRHFGQIESEFDLSDLTQIQTVSYSRFLQVEKGPRERRNQGLEEILHFLE